MKKILLIAIAAIALVACGEQNKYDAALDEYEAIIDKTVEAIKSGDQIVAENLDRQLTDLGPTIQEIDEKGTDAQKSRKQTLALKLLGAMFGAIDTTQINNAFQQATDQLEQDGSLQQLGKELDESLNKAADEIGKGLNEGLNQAAGEIKKALDKAFE